MGNVIRRRGVVHRMARAVQVDALSGDEAVVWSCPVCGRVERDGVVVIDGDAPTADDATRFAEMAKTPAGRLDLSAILRRYPLHDKVWIDQAGMMALAGDVPAGIGPALRLEWSE